MLCPMSDKKICIGVIGGSGLGDALGAEQGRTHEIDTPFGTPSGPVIEAQWDGRTIYLLQRHGPGHVLNPSAVPYRANIFALKRLGVTHILASGATGSLREEMRPGDLVVVDQVIDKTTKRANTFYERAAVHVELSEPFCPVMRRWLLGAAQSVAPETKVHDKGTYICMEGPAFSTRAESHMHRAWGGDLIGMTAMPEARLAREAEISYATVALATDYDCWHESEEEVSVEAVIAVVKKNAQRARRVVARAVDKVPAEHTCIATNALDNAILTAPNHISAEKRQKLGALLGRYFGS